MGLKRDRRSSQSELVPSLGEASLGSCHNMVAIAKTLLLLLAVLFFPGALTLTSQPIDVDVELGATALLPFENYDDSKTVLLTKFHASKSTDSPIATVISLNPDELLGSAVGLGQFKGRVRLKTHGSTAIRAELDNIQLNDTGPDIFYEFQQPGVRGRRININIKDPPPAVSSLNITSVGEDYVNITWLQVEPLDPTPVNYSVEYREAAKRARRNLQATDDDDTWQQTDHLQHNPDVPNLQMKVNGLSPGVEYESRVVSTNRFGTSYSHVELAETVRKAPQTGTGLASTQIAGIAIGAAVGVIVALLICYLLVKMYQRRSSSSRRRHLDSLRDMEEGRPLNRPEEEEQPAEEEEQPAEEEEQPAEEQPAEMQPAEEEEQPAEEEEQPAEVQPAEVQPAEVQPAEVPPAKVPPAEVPPAELEPAEVQPAEEEGQPVMDGQEPASNDKSIPPQHYIEEGGGSDLSEIPAFNLVDPDRFAGDDIMEPSMIRNDLDVQTDVIPSESGRHKAAKYEFPYSVATYYECKKDDPDKDKITEVKNMLSSNSWEIGVFDPHDQEDGGMLETFKQSFKKCRHAIVFLTRLVAEYMEKEEDSETEYQSLTFLRKKLSSRDKKFNRKLIVIKLCNSETPFIFCNLTVLRYGEPGFKMKLFNALSIPEGPHTPPPDQVKRRIDLFKKTCKRGGISDDKLRDVAAGLQIPEDVFDDICSPQMYGESGSNRILTAVVDCWITHYGEEASMEQLEEVLTGKKCSSSSPQIQKAEPYQQSPDSLDGGNPTKPAGTNPEKVDTTNTQRKTGDSGQDYTLLRDILSRSLEDRTVADENRERLQQHVAESGLVFRDPVPGDGNCLFHAISDQLERLGAEALSHQQLRARAVHRLRKHPYTASGEHMGCFLSNESSWEGYLDQMEKDRHWGDAHVIIALANYLGRDIRIVSSIDSEMYDVIIEPTSSPNNNNAPILLGHYAENHYESLDVARQDGIAHQAAAGSRMDIQEHGGTVAGRPAVQNDNESTPLLPQPQEDRTTQQPVLGATTDVQEHREEVAGRPAVQDDNESTPLLPQPQEDACSQSANTNIKIRHVKKMQWGDHNEMNSGRARPKTAGSRSHRKTAPQRKGGHGKHQDSGSSIGNVDIDIEDVENFQMGDYNVMNISTLPGQETKDSSRDAGNPSATQSDSSRVVTDSDFQEIQEHIGNKWKAVASGLGLSQGQIDGLEHDLRHETLDEKVYQMLRKWKQLNGQLATVAELTGALREVGLQDVANRIEN